jgi:hypothetical protein
LFAAAYELWEKAGKPRAETRNFIIRLSGNWRGNLKTPKLPKTF